MDENKNFEEKAEESVEEIKETAEEVAEEIEEVAENLQEDAEEFAENVEEKAEDFVEEVQDAAKEVAEEAKDFAQEVFEAPKKKNIAPVVALIVVVAIVIVLGILTGMGKIPQIYNKYNHMGYVNITDRTISDIAEESGMELSELLEQYGLPADMPGNTKESAAYYMMPTKMIAQMYGMGFEELKELLAFDEDVTEDTPWGIAEGEVTLEKYIGAENFDSFKEEYGLGDEITLETKWKEVRNIVDGESKRKYEEQNAEKEKAAEETDAEAEVTEEETEQTEETEGAE